MLCCADLCAGLDQVDAELAKLEEEDNVMHQDMVQQVRHPGAFRLSSQPKGAVSAAQAIDDVSMKYQAVVHTHVNGLEQEGLAVMRIPEQSCPPLPSQVSSPPPSPPHLVAATQLGHSNLMSAQAPGTFAAEDEEAIDAEIAALHKQLAERTAEHQHLRQQLAEEEQQGCAALLPLSAQAARLTGSSCFAGLGAPRSCRSCRALSGLRHRPCQGVWCRRSAH